MNMKVCLIRCLFILTVIGVIAGTIFGLFLKMVEQFTHKKVYTLLLNVDYFPILKDVKLSEWSEFSLHLIVSVLVTLVLFASLKRYDRQYIVVYYVVLNGLIAMLLYWTTIFSDRTPQLLDIEAWLYWLIGHILFGIVQGWLIKNI